MNLGRFALIAITSAVITLPFAFCSIGCKRAACREESFHQTVLRGPRVSCHSPEAVMETKETLFGVHVTCRCPKTR